MSADHKQIGEVAERTGLSLRTIRYYEEIGLVVPSARTAGGFRLYTEDDIDRLALVRRMKPLDFTLDEMRELLEILDRLEDPAVPEQERDRLADRLAEFRQVTDERCAKLRARLGVAEEFAHSLRTHPAAAHAGRSAR